MAQFTITIKTDNDAFADGNCAVEVCRILREVSAVIISNGMDNGFARDINGNKVCQFKYEDDAS